MAVTPPGSRFESLRKRAKTWLRALKNGDTAALERLRQTLPNHSLPPRLREVQLALAREEGFTSWNELKEHQAIEALVGDEKAPLLDVFLEHACIFTRVQDLSFKWKRAERIRTRRPDIATGSLHSAVVCGEVEHVRSLLEADPDAIRSTGGPQCWEPLLFACYGRLPNPRASERGLEMARVLLDAGADPNTYFVSDDEWKLRFSALCGAMGQGEMGQPEHPHADALARLLLERGADPNESQGLYNTHLVGDDTRWLELLFEYGLNAEAPINWHSQPADASKSGADKCASILDYLISGAAGNAHCRRLALLLKRGANPNARSIYDGNTCSQRAQLNGDREALRVLVEGGATVTPLEGHDAFVAAVRSGDRREAERAIGTHPEYLKVGDPLTEAAQRGERQAVRLFLELGVDPNAPSQHGHLALNNGCEDRRISVLLLRHGADPRGRAFGGTACGWAHHAGNQEMARFHAEQSRSLLDAATSGHVELARGLLKEEPGCVGDRSPLGNTVLHELNGELSLAEPLLHLLLEAGADPHAKNDAGETPTQRLERMGSDEVADLLDALTEV